MTILAICLQGFQEWCYPFGVLVEVMIRIDLALCAFQPFPTNSKETAGGLKQWLVQFIEKRLIVLYIPQRKAMAEEQWYLIAVNAMGLEQLKKTAAYCFCWTRLHFA